ncbi:ser/Thr protein phosphatase family protein [Glonium stellatum]|uniref:Ser/Thr protein phosphatase family protein n=1 Tax=Glonium stellatum TaxID=574774 RepID=A0A8E2JWT3_9PEZI|nr:ser/Thr protein phosphatase family protein [Glonium stellatum]
MPVPTPSLQQRIKTRFLIISDTHSAQLDLQENGPRVTTPFPFRKPLPRADVLLHCGDLTKIGHLDEYRKTLDMLGECDAELKLVIAGNHDISLDEEYYRREGMRMHRHAFDPKMPKQARDMWMGEEARRAGVTYLDEGSHAFALKSGAKLRIYVSPYQPEFCDWAFPYERGEDRFNPPDKVTPGATSIAKNPVPDFPQIDVMMTHGPPLGRLDKTFRGEEVGCEHLLRAARRCKPRLYCFGHIHEGWGAERVLWDPSESLDQDWCKHIAQAEPIAVDYGRIVQERAVHVDISSFSAVQPLEFGRETLMVNASIMNLMYQPQQSPWVIDVDLWPADNG